MNVEIKEKDGVKIAEVSGDIDSKTAPEAQEILLKFVAENKTVVLDLKSVGFMSSAGLRMMLLLYRHANAGNGRLALVGLSEQIRDTMAATGFLRFFTVCGDIPEALASLKK